MNDAVKKKVKGSFVARCRDIRSSASIPAAE